MATGAATAGASTFVMAEQAIAAAVIELTEPKAAVAAIAVTAAAAITSPKAKEALEKTALFVMEKAITTPLNIGENVGIFVIKKALNGVEKTKPYADFLSAKIKTCSDFLSVKTEACYDFLSAKTKDLCRLSFCEN
jgi:hypothetical protein